LHLLQGARLLQAPERGDDRVEQKQQNEQAILVVVQQAVAGLVARAAVVVQTLEQRRQAVEVFQPRDVGFRDLVSFLTSGQLRLLPIRQPRKPAERMRKLRAESKENLSRAMRKSCAEQYWDRSK
jgi:hypothetical protein